MRKNNLLVLVTLISGILAGCTDGSNQSEAPAPAGLNSVNSVDSVDSISSRDEGVESSAITDRSLENIRQITLTWSLNQDAVNPEAPLEYTDPETIDLFVRAVHSAVRIPGILNITAPDYDMVLASEQEQYALRLWINESSEQAMIMDKSDTHTGYALTQESTAELMMLMFAESSFEELAFSAKRNSAGDLVAVPKGLPENNYSLSGGPAAELQGVMYHTIHLFYGDHNAINALVAHDPTTDEVHVGWSDELHSSDNGWNNAFMSSYNLLIPWDEEHLLFLESELTEEAGQYHLSAYNVVTGAVERLREDFWPLTQEYDYIYMHQWNADKQQLFLQSYLGNVWIFDLKTGDDELHLLKYPVIPHSTTGAPSLFLSPTLERFVHDDESGQLTFFNNKGVQLRTIALPADQYVPSEKIKWNPAGTIAWMDQAPMDQNRILGIDIDYLKIAPQEIRFFDPDGLPIASVQAQDGTEGAAVEVAGWMDANIAVMKSYTLKPGSRSDAAPELKDASYFLYDVKNKKQGSRSKSMPPDAAVTADRQGHVAGNTENIIVSHSEITYKAIEATKR
ncbi:hypothetical protein [Paenibacillus borealis]|uniref:YhfM-like domain-containing protein n=1 Tax=Paenibacillus borealis TaxID=160799 RepID=A0A089LFB2_PAEBO|nr:hypothetical protein [Paenibacillus borealis]AIQ58785.1 hypothetical protein PBOR_18985 [Paenibacillus borealis]